MNDYFYLLEYKKEREELNRLNEELSKMILHRFVSRTVNGSQKYAERYSEGGVRHERTLSDEELYILNSENEQYLMMKARIADLSKSVSCMRNTARKCYDRVCSEFERLNTQAGSRDYYKCSGTFMPQFRENRTLRGDFVRSKSEVFIADVLFMHGINYIYECDDSVERKLPDFYIPENIRGVPVIWEHFGKMDSPDYVGKCLNKLDDYKAAGFTPGRNLIITFESYSDESRRVFDSNKAEKVVQEWFLPESVKI